MGVAIDDHRSPITRMRAVKSGDWKAGGGERRGGSPHPPATGPERHFGTGLCTVWVLL